MGYRRGLGAEFAVGPSQEIVGWRVDSLPVLVFGA